MRQIGRDERGRIGAVERRQRGNQRAVELFDAEGRLEGGEGGGSSNVRHNFRSIFARLYARSVMAIKRRKFEFIRTNSQTTHILRQEVVQISSRASAIA